MFSVPYKLTYLHHKIKFMPHKFKVDFCNLLAKFPWKTQEEIKLFQPLTTFSTDTFPIFLFFCIITRERHSGVTFQQNKQDKKFKSTGNSSS